ncbi:MAG TPA: DUF86 domain-containing protein [Chitinophagaceae bacterium]|jgi:uncharacterized protein with HEPN domain
MKGKIPDKIRLYHILDAIRNIENFSANKTKEDLYNNLMYRFSVERQLEIIGEAANNLSPSICHLHCDIPWEKIISFRNLLAHEYFGLDLELIWGIINENIPQLKIDIQRILKTDFPN